MSEKGESLCLREGSLLGSCHPVRYMTCQLDTEYSWNDVCCKLVMANHEEGALFYRLKTTACTGATRNDSSPHHCTIVVRSDFARSKSTVKGEVTAIFEVSVTCLLCMHGTLLQP